MFFESTLRQADQNPQESSGLKSRPHSYGLPHVGNAHDAGEPTLDGCGGDCRRHRKLLRFSYWR